VITSEEYQELKNRILSRRKLMIGVSSEDHWLKLHNRIREVFKEAFDKIRDDQLASITGFSKQDIQRWMEQEKAVQELKRRVQVCRRSGKGKNMSLTILVRPDICALARLAPITRVAEAVGIPRPTLGKWVKAGWDKVDIPGEFEKDLESAAREAEEDQVIDITRDAQAKQLEIFLERHKGKARRKYSLAEKKLILSVQERFGSKAVHDYFGVSYDTISRLKRRDESELERKKRIPMRYIPVVDIMKKHPGMGPMQIRDYIRRHLGLSMGVNSIRKVMEQSGWVPPFAKTTRVTEGLRLYEAARKNYMWHMDFKHQYVNKCKVYILFIQDDYARFIVGHGLSDGEKVDVVLAAVEECIRIHGKPEVIMNDGGSAFFSWRGSSRFTRFLEDYGIEQLVAQTPNVNGKLENLNGQVEKELIMVTDFASVDHFRRELSKWVGFYNFARPHQGLGDTKVPADRYFPGAKQWYGETTDITRQQSLIAETMSTLLTELKKPK